MALPRAGVGSLGRAAERLPPALGAAPPLVKSHAAREQEHLKLSYFCRKCQPHVTLIIADLEQLLFGKEIVRLTLPTQQLIKRGALEAKTS